MKKWIVLLLLVGCLPGHAEEPAEKAPEKKKEEKRSEDEALTDACVSWVKIATVLSLYQNGYSHEEVKAYMEEWDRTGKMGKLEEPKVKKDKVERWLLESHKDQHLVKKVEEKKVEESKTEAKKVEEPKAPPKDWKDSPEYQEKINELREKSKKKINE